MDEHIDLGFAVRPKSRHELTSTFFPSKIGGRPAWLSLKTIPGQEALRCSVCRLPMTFLLQVYAPIDGREDAFHRTLFVFCCRDDRCGQLKVWRSQLARNNEFYSSQPPNYDDNGDCQLRDDAVDYGNFGVKLCTVCGCPADKTCANCRRVDYCSKEHQTVDWTEGRHKKRCNRIYDERPEKSLSVLFPEFAIEIESLNDCSDNSDDDEDAGAGRRKSDKIDDRQDEASELDKMKAFNDYINKSDLRYQNLELDDYCEEENEEQKAFRKFVKSCENAKDQVIRYYRVDCLAEEPLWISKKNKPESIPSCESCGSQRRFEFQIMPQLLRMILNDRDSLDWGVVVVYTCKDSCQVEGEGYRQEFVWKQGLS